MSKGSWISRLLGRKPGGEELPAGAAWDEAPTEGDAEYRKHRDRGRQEWNNKGVALAELGRHEEALACYDPGLAIDPRDSDMWNNKGVALYGLGHPEEALVCFDQGLEIDPHKSGLWQGKGAMLKMMGRAQEAEECFRRAQELGSG